MAEAGTSDFTISATIWRCYERSGPAQDGHWEFKGAVTADEAESAARQHCVNAWASGAHAILVVNADEAREFVVTVDTKEVASRDKNTLPTGI